MLNTTQLAQELGLSKGRISQLVGAGRLAGCFSGEGRARRFDPLAVKRALTEGLDPAQMLGNGAKTRLALQHIGEGVDGVGASPEPERAPVPVAKPMAPRDGAELPASDPGRYEMARTQKAEEEARKLRRSNLEAEGSFVLAAEVERQVAAIMGQEVAEFEAVLRDAARQVADRMAVDMRICRKILTDVWRGHRQKRSEVLSALAEVVTMTDAEKSEDI